MQAVSPHEQSKNLGLRFPGTSMGLIGADTIKDSDNNDDNFTESTKPLLQNSTQAGTKQKFNLKLNTDGLEKYN